MPACPHCAQFDGHHAPDCPALNRVLVEAQREALEQPRPLRQRCPSGSNARLRARVAELEATVKVLTERITRLEKPDA